MPPRVLHYHPHLVSPQKDHLLAAHESVREENRAPLRSNTQPAFLSLSWQVYSSPGFDAWCRVFLWRHHNLSFMSGKLILWCALLSGCFFSSRYYLHLSRFFASSVSETFWVLTLNEISRHRGEKWIKGTWHQKCTGRFYFLWRTSSRFWRLVCNLWRGKNNSCFLLDRKTTNKTT